VTQLSLFEPVPAAGETAPRELPGPAPAAGSGPVRQAPVPAELAEVASRLPPTLRLGTSSWSFPGWAGIVYDRPHTESRLARHGLAAYARHPLLTAAGIDRTHYAPLPAAELAAYAAAVPAGFSFVVKAHEACTVAHWPEHARYGARRGEANPLFLDPAYAAGEVVAPFVEGLGGTAGALLFQFAPQDLGPLGGADRFVGRLGRFLAALPRGPLYAVELRNKELLGPPYAAALAAAGAVHCLNVHPRMPDLGTQARDSGALGGPALLVRWMLGNDLSYEAARQRYRPFDRLVDEAPAVRRTVAALALDAAAAGKPVYVIANNKAEGSAPLTLFRLAELIARLRSRGGPAATSGDRPPT
jgi:uncharacterized protein YecE (DUF72 family)